MVAKTGSLGGVCLGFMFHVGTGRGGAGYVSELGMLRNDVLNCSPYRDKVCNWPLDSSCE
jgi:hypothetical protein